MSRVKAREQARKTIEEHRTENENTPKNYKNIAISYESDEAELIPETRKVEIETHVPEQPKVRKKRATKKEMRDHSIENEGEKILMKGDVEVVDVTDGAQDPHTTVLEPTIISVDDADKSRGAPKKKSVANTKKRKEKAPAMEASIENSKKTTDFMTKLETLEALPIEDEKINTGNGAENLPTPPGEAQGEEGDSYMAEVGSPKLLYLSVFLLGVLAVLLTLPVSISIDYTSDAHNALTKSFDFNVEELKDAIQKRI
jgi:hypothetical protein